MNDERTDGPEPGAPDPGAAPTFQPLSPFELGSKVPSGEGRTGSAQPPSRPNVPRGSGVDGHIHAKLSRGKLRPEARLDLHGMTLTQAHPALTRFIQDASGQGRRLVLVITGKGKDREDGGVMPVRRGVLRHQVPHWLATPPLSNMVVQVSQAHFRHGGDGAYYVYLRRRS